MMTLEEAIMHCQEKSCGNSECAKEHEQLAQWLIELQHYRNVWKDQSSQKPKKGEIVFVQLYGHQMYIGKYYIDPDENGREGVFLEPSQGLIYLKDVDKWAYPKDVFPFSNNSTIELFDYSDGKSKRSSSSNRELESHKAWEESLLIADRLR